MRRFVSLGAAILVFAVMPVPLPVAAQGPACIVTGARCLPASSEADAAMQLILSHSAELVLDRPSDGCAPRAVVIADLLAEAGIPIKAIGKVWNVAIDPRDEQPTSHVLRVYVPGSEDEGRHAVYWGWHVAVTLDVNTGDGSFETLIFDPTLFNRPVRLREWRRAMHDRLAVTLFTRLGESPAGQGIGYGLVDDPELTELAMRESAIYHLQLLREARDRAEK